jgi:very-short-patch-repair endonuclease
VRREGRFLGRVDVGYPDQRIAIELDGFATHGSPAALQRDLRRQNRIVLEGWLVLRFTWADVVERPGEVAATVARALGAASRRYADGFAPQERPTQHK